MTTLYTAHVTSVGGREGSVTSDDHHLALQLGKPGSKGTTNPEQLFAAGYSACFLSAAAFIAKQKNIPAADLKVKADVNLNQDESGFFLSVTLNMSVSGLASSAAEQLMQDAHKMCPYSKATRGNIEVTLKINDQPLSAAA